MRSRRLRLLLAAPLILLLVFGSLYLILGHDGLASLPRHKPVLFSRPPNETVQNGTVLSAADISTYLDAIFDLKPTKLASLKCPALNAARYASLKATEHATAPEIQYFFALDLRQCVELLPRLIGSVVEAIRFLGPLSCALSIVEGNSADGTADVLAALRPRLEALGVRYSLQSTPVNPRDGDRIPRLAQLRNMALEPLYSNPGSVSNDTAVLFLNDVAACSEDILELAAQRRALAADMTCAMDWTYVGPDPTFYDVWIARGINGDSFFEIPPDGNWNSAWNLFWNAPDTRSRFQEQRPFQVFSCWNGAVALTARPLLDNIRFRASNESAGECHQGEPELLCKDMWFRGYGRIAVIPSVNLEYSSDKGRKIKEAKGYTSDIVAGQDAAGDAIDWKLEPPETVKCMADWSNQVWQPWNTGLV